MSSAFASGKNSRAICDRCGLTFRYTHLRPLIVRKADTGLRVCASCWEADHPQNSLGDKPIHDPQALRNPRPDTGKDASRQLVDMDKLDEFLQG